MATLENRTAEGIARAAKLAFEASQLVPSSERTAVLEAIRQKLAENKEIIFEANRIDLEVCNYQSKPH